MTEVQAPPDDERPRFEIDPWERIWLVVSIVVLTIFAGALLVSAVGFGFSTPSKSGRVDPNTVTESGPFSEPGLRHLEGDEYVAYVVARQFAFEPANLVVPQGATVTFRVTSVDVQHGFKIAGTNVNMMALPGQIAELEATFDDLGDFAYVCSEFCQIGHERMFGSVTVVPEEEFEG